MSFIQRRVVNELNFKEEWSGKNARGKTAEVVFLIWKKCHPTYFSGRFLIVENEDDTTNLPTLIRFT